MPDSRPCPRCGTALPAGALGGLCPACLLQQGVAVDTFTGSEPASAFVPPTVSELAAKFPSLEITELIGRGGMGAVYRARQWELDRVVALKILPPGIGDAPAFAERFAREAKALAQLNHPNIVTLYEFGRADGLYFFLMEFVDGVNLRQLLHAGRVEPREALAIVPQICDALQFAHDHGVVHRDIKPENLLLDRRGRVKVADFGLAKIVAAGTETASDAQASADTEFTAAGKVMGTPGYMAPEQTERPRDVDHRVDIYALGVVFYQMLTGELPAQRLEPPSRKVHIDVRLDEVVLRALEKEPVHRYAQASLLKERVETIVAENPTGNVREISPRIESVRPWAPWPLVRAGLICWLAAGIFGLVAWVLCLHLPRVYRATSVVQVRSSAQDRLAGMGRAISSSAGQAGVDVAAREIPHTELIEISVYSADPRQAATIANTAAETARHVPATTGQLWSRAQVPMDFYRSHRAILAVNSLLVMVLILTCSGLVSLLTGLYRRWHQPNPLLTLAFVAAAVALLMVIIVPFSWATEYFRNQQAPVSAADAFAPRESSDQLAQEGWQLWQSQQPAKAVEKFQASLKLAPDNANTWNGLGWASLNAGRVREAEQAFQKVIALEPGHPAALNGLGQIYLSQRRYEQAETYLLKAAPQAPAAWYGLTRLYLLQGKFAEAQKYAQRVVDTGQADAVAAKMLDAAREGRLSDGLRAMIEPPPIPPTAVPTAEARLSPGMDAALADQPPQLRALGWQDQVKTRPDEMSLPSGGRLGSRAGFPAFAGLDIAAVAGQDPRNLCLWFSHPLFDAQSVADVTLLDSGGQTPLKTPVSHIASGYTSASPSHADVGWITMTVCAGSKGQTPPAATVRLRYSVGPWRQCAEIAADYRGSKTLANGVLLAAQGQDADGQTFVQIVCDRSAGADDTQLDFVAVKKDDQRLERTGSRKSGVVQVFTERFSFNVPLADVKSFECRVRPIRVETFKILLPP